MASSNSTSNATCSDSCYMKATSDGVFAGQHPIDYALPLLIIQLCLVLFFSRVFAFILKPLRQPRVIAEILGGIVLGTSVMGRIPGFTAAIFPKKSLTVLTTVANLGLLYFLFLIGLELDLRSLSKVGLQAMGIAATGIIVPFALGIGASFAARSILGLTSAFGPFLVFMGVAMSITAFPVLARILAERKLLTTDVGQVAMSAAAVNDVVAWVLLALAVALSTPDASAAVVGWILLCGVAFVLVMFFGVRPLMALLCRGIISNDPIPEWIVAITFVGVLVCAFVTDTVGIHGIFGAFIFGLVVPKDGPFATMILEKIEDFVTIVLLPLYFASSGLAVDFEALTTNSIGLIFIIIGAACAGKIGGTFVSSWLAGLPLRKCLALGILMNTKGLVELIVLNIGLSKNVINVELYTIMVIMALVTTFMTTPLVMLIYKPARERRAHTKTIVQQTMESEDELRLLECVYGAYNLPSILNLTESFRGTRKHPLRVYLMHLLELSERPSAIVMVTRVRKDGRPYWSKEAEKRGQDQVVVAFRAYAELSRVNVVPLTAISNFDNMHEDICITAEDRRTSLIVMPYYKSLNAEGEEVVNHNFQTVTRKLLRTAPCSVAILVDRGLGGFSHVSPSNVEKHVAVLFFGGPDDREAITLARRMVEHPGVTLTVIHFNPTDEAAIGLEIEQQQKDQPKGLAESLSAASFVVMTDQGIREKEEKEDQVALQPILDMLPLHGAGPERRSSASSDVSGDAASAAHDKSKDIGSSGGAENDQEAGGPNAASGQDAVDARPRTQRPSRAKVAYEKRTVDDAAAAILAVGNENFNLLIVGRGRRPPVLLAGLAAQQTPLRSYYRPPRLSQSLNSALPPSESSGSDLGPVGDLLATSDIPSSILVVQQHDEAMVRSLSTV